MRTGVLLLNFGEPERAHVDEVVPFLESIFLANSRLEHATDPAAGRRRARQLAEQRAPGLMADYGRMGPSPLHWQTRMQARALDVELRHRGIDAIVSVGMQFTAPTIEDAARTLRDAGVGHIVAIPLYPLCGPSTTIFALRATRTTLDAIPWDTRVTEITGWHRHEAYVRVRSRAVTTYCEEQGVHLDDPKTRLIFSAHGTPLRYLREGSRYELYVRDHCASLARALNVGTYSLGFQNHANRPGVEWTEPGVPSVLAELSADRVVVVPVSFMHEQSETLVELDLDLRVTAEDLGLDFHRVPIPHDAPDFVDLLGELVDRVQSGAERSCRCRPGAFCLNAGLSD